jgi:endonuclease G
MKKLPAADKPHQVPSGYWKIIAVPRAGSFDVVGFILDQNTLRRESFCAHRATPGEIEQRTKLSFFPELDLDMKQRIAQGLMQGRLVNMLGC